MPESLEDHCSKVTRAIPEDRVVPLLAARAGVCDRSLDADGPPGSYLQSVSEFDRRIPYLHGRYLWRDRLGGKGSRDAIGGCCRAGCTPRRVPALVWIGARTTAVCAVAVGALLALNHLVIADERVIKVWAYDIKRGPDPAAAFSIAVDHSSHILYRLVAALAAA